MLYSEESMAWLKEQILGKTLYCQLVVLDQYRRVVRLSWKTVLWGMLIIRAQVAVPVFAPRFLPGFLARGNCISLEMLHAGWATTYTKTGADYGDYGLAEFQRIEKEAQCVPPPNS